MKINGACHCGAITYEVEIDPERYGICHCTDCQTLSASAFRTVALVAGNSFWITRGVPKEYVKTAQSGNRRVQAFCGDCGSGLYASDPGDNPAQYNIRAGTIAQRYDLIPRFEVWQHSALPWVPENPTTKKFDGNPQ